jgi:hypothetical protein
MAQRLEVQLSKADERVEQQRRWLIDHGRNEAGYVARYGSHMDREHVGDGGEAIFAADLAKYSILIDERDRIAFRLQQRNFRLSRRVED